MLSPLTDMWPVRIIVSLVVRPLRRAVAYCAGRRFVYTLTLRHGNRAVLRGEYGAGGLKPEGRPPYKVAARRSQAPVTARRFPNGEPEARHPVARGAQAGH